MQDPTATKTGLFSANTLHWPNAGLMLSRRRSRWGSIHSGLGQCIVFAGFTIKSPPSVLVVARVNWISIRSYLTFSSDCLLWLRRFPVYIRRWPNAVPTSCIPRPLPWCHCLFFRVCIISARGATAGTLFIKTPNVHLCWFNVGPPFATLARR